MASRSITTLLLIMMMPTSRFRCFRSAFATAFSPQICQQERSRYTNFQPLSSSSVESDTRAKTSSRKAAPRQAPLINLYTIGKEELQEIVQSWGYPRYRADQVWGWVRDKGVTDVSKMGNIPKKLQEDLQKYSSPSAQTQQPAVEGSKPSAVIHDSDGCLELVMEQVSPKDGTIKRLYRLQEGHLIESVLMPYEDGRYTACISSQAGCAQGCVFCATGQSGFDRQLTANEIVEQVTRFSTYLQQLPPVPANHPSQKRPRQPRLSNIVFMGMGEPLANYKRVIEAVRRIQDLAGIGARKITISTVGIVEGIRKLMEESLQVRLAVSLHCASDEERSALLPANRRNGGLKELMSTLREYVHTTGRRITLEWALIDGQNDTPEMARQLGNLVRKNNLRLVHVNVIPLNPTGGYAGSPTGRKRVNEFIRILEEEYGISCTPRVRRGIDIDAGCGQLKSKALELEKVNPASNLGVYEDVGEDDHDDDGGSDISLDVRSDTEIVDLDVEYGEADDDYPMDASFDPAEALRLLDMVKGTTVKIEEDPRESQLKP